MAPKKKIITPDATAGDNLGRHVDVYGENIIVGAYVKMKAVMKQEQFISIKTIAPSWPYPPVQTLKK